MNKKEVLKNIIAWSLLVVEVVACVLWWNLWV